MGPPLGPERRSHDPTNYPSGPGFFSLWDLPFSLWGGGPMSQILKKYSDPDSHSGPYRSALPLPLLSLLLVAGKPFVLMGKFATYE